MQVFNLFLRIIYTRRISIAVYVAVYLVLLLGVVVPGAAGSTPTDYVRQKCKFALQDEDNSGLSRGLAQNLMSNHELVEIKDFSRETLQDEHYNENIGAAIVIKEGFEKAFMEGNGADHLLIYDIPGENKARLIRSDVDEFLRYTETCIRAGYSVEGAMAEAEHIDGIETDVEFVGEKELTVETDMTLFFKFLSWVFVLMIVSELSPVLVTLDRKEVKDRMECSSFMFSRFNGQILMGSMVMGLLVVVVFSVAAKVAFGSEFTGIRAGLFILNLICYMFVALSIMFLISRVTASESVISMMANIVSLGMSFLCGIFVPFYLLGESIRTAAHFLPAYWYSNAVAKIHGYSGGSLTEIWQCMGTQILFAGVILVAGLLVAKNKRVA